VEEQFRQNLPANIQHTQGHTSDFPLGTGTAAVFKKIEERTAIHG